VWIGIDDRPTDFVPLSVALAPAELVGVAQPGRVRVQRGSGWQRLDAILRRQPSLPLSTMSQWCVRRSSNAVVIFGSPKTLGYSPKARSVVTMIEVRS
jgi:hypothetical protein